MFYDVVTSTDILFHLMVAVGVIGIIAKNDESVYNSPDAGSSGKYVQEYTPTDKIGTLKYEQACMLRDSVEKYRSICGEIYL